MSKQEKVFIIKRRNLNIETLIENDKGHNIKLDFKWIDLDEIDNFDIRPKFLKDLFKNKSGKKHSS